MHARRFGVPDAWRTIVAALALGVATSGVLAIALFHFRVPYWDMITTLHFYFNSPFAWFLCQPENEHIHATAKLLYWADIRFAQASGILLEASILAAIAGISAIVARGLEGASATAWPGWLTGLVAAATLLWLGNWENLLWPKQVHVYLSILAQLGALLIVSMQAPTRPSSSRAIATILLLQLVSTMSFGYGLAGCAILPLIAFRQRLDRRAIVSLSIGCLLVGALWVVLTKSYSNVYVSASLPSVSFSSLAAIPRYAVRLITAPMVELLGSLTTRRLASLLAEVLAYGGMCWLAYDFSVAMSGRHGPSSSFGSGIALFGLANAVTTAIARSGADAGTAGSSRYYIVALLFWLGIVVSLEGAARDLRRWPLIAVRTLAAAMLALMALGQYTTWNAVRLRSADINATIPRLLDGDFAGSTLARLYPEAALPIANNVFSELRRRKLSIWSGDRPPHPTPAR